jgi:N-acetylglucosaminyl-diphospho-decaprenol L-rhamnosyltransferase
VNAPAAPSARPADDVDMIIVNHNTRDELADCLKSLHDARPACVARIIVVDNHSTDDSVATVERRWPDVEIRALDHNIGFGPANNVALRESTASYCLLLNSDTVVPPGAIDALLDRLIANGATAAGPLLRDGHGRPEISFGPMLAPWSELVQKMRVRLAARGGSLADWYVGPLVSAERFVDWVTGACLLVRREAARDAGFFDERYFLYEEDVDFCAALRARGGTILFTPRAEVQHLRGRSAPSRASRAHYDRSHLAFYEKHHPAWAPALRLWQQVRGRRIR